MSDAIKLSADMGFTDSWRPDPVLWGSAATKVLAKIESRLNCFPSEEKTWMAWMAWSQFKINGPNVSTFINTLPIWGSREEWIRNLPEVIVLEEARELMAQKKFSELEKWCQAWMTHGSENIHESKTNKNTNIIISDMYIQARKVLNP